jgi:amidophosphoribosyltransferase
VANITYFGLYALQHRGQESAGICVSDGKKLTTIKEMGLVSQVFDSENLNELRGDLAIGHTRYSTTGSPKVVNAQPMLCEHPTLGSIAIAHNGNLTNHKELREELTQLGIKLNSGSDTEVIIRFLSKTPGPDLKSVLRVVLPRLKGAYSLVLMTKDSLVAVRDSLSVRPLVLGQTKDGEYIVASETCALDTIRANFLREVGGGEAIIITKDGLNSFLFQTSLRQASCMFELIYFARPDSNMMGKNLYEARRRMGQELAKQLPVKAGVVISVPDSGTPAAHGYAEESGIPFREGLIRSRYITRTFIQPTQSLREEGVRLKFNPVRPVLEGKSVVIVDDSIVRGTSSRQLIDLVRWAGAKKVHLRIASPPLHFPCYMGIDIASKKELIAVGRTEKELAEILGCDSLAYLKMEDLVKAVGSNINNFCLACFDGQYPVDVKEEEKSALESELYIPSLPSI